MQWRRMQNPSSCLDDSLRFFPFSLFENFHGWEESLELVSEHESIFSPDWWLFYWHLPLKLLTFEWQAAGPEFSNSFRKRKETRKTATDMFIPLLVILITKQKSPKFLFIFLFLQVTQGSSSHLQNYIVDSHKWLYCVSPHLFTVSSIQNNFASFFSYHLIFCFFSLFLFTFVDKILLIFTFFIMPMVYFLLLPSCNFNIF